MNFKDLINQFRPKKKLADNTPNYNQKSEESIFNKMSEVQWCRMDVPEGWGEIPKYKPEPLDQEQIIQALEYFAENQEEFPLEFRETFKKRMRDILA